jgi:hypothetical protein
MTEEEFKAEPTYRGWSAGERKTFQGLLDAYRAKRLEVGPFKYITRHMLKDAYGTTHVGTASKFQSYIEEIENDQPPRKRHTEAPRQPDSPEPAPPAIQMAFDGVRKALEAALNTVLECRAREGLELAETYQRFQREYLAAADARERALCERIAGLEADSTGTGEESCDLAANVEELRAALQAATSERDAAVVRAEQAAHSQQLDHVQRAAAEALVEALKASAVHHSGEVWRLQGRCTALEGAAAEVPELRADNAALRERADALADQIRRQENVILEMNRRHEEERAAIRAAHDRELGEERQRSADREARLLGLVAHGRNEETMQGNGGPTPSGERA